MTDEGIRILIHKRTPQHGHLTAELSLSEAVHFADAELALHRAVILEIGSESLVVRTGKEIIDFVRRVLGGKKEPKPLVTTLTPMAGGAVDRLPPPNPMVMPLRYDGPAAMEAPMNRMPGTLSRTPPEADLRAWQALIERIGERAARAIIAGGGYSVRSTLWPYVLYVVTPDIIKVINQGVQVSRICIVALDGGSIWDAVLNRIQLLEAGIDGEVQVFATGALMGP